MYKILLWNLVIKAIVCKIHRTSDLLKHQWNSDEGELTEINKHVKQLNYFQQTQYNGRL